MLHGEENGLRTVSRVTFSKLQPVECTTPGYAVCVCALLICRFVHRNNSIRIVSARGGRGRRDDDGNILHLCDNALSPILASLKMVVVVPVSLCADAEQWQCEQ